MSDPGVDWSDLETLARERLGRIRRNPSTGLLYEEIVKGREGQLAHLGSVVIRTGYHAERTADDRYLVGGVEDLDRVPLAAALRPMETSRFDALAARMLAYLRGRDVFVQDGHTGAAQPMRMPVRVVTTTAWHSLVARTMLWPAPPGAEPRVEPAFTVIHAAAFPALPAVDGTASASFVALHPGHRVALVGGTSYAGELMATVAAMRVLCRPRDGALPVRCAASVGASGEVAAFLGRTASGKTALAVDPRRRLVGDGEHAWTDDGLVALDRGVYPRVLDLAPADEPQVDACTRRFGTLLENVGLDPRTRRIEFSDRSLTENARAVFPVSHVEGAVADGTCGHPRDLFMLVRDPTGVMPPIARLTPEQAVFAFLLGYSSSRVETESAAGVASPEAMRQARAAAGMGPHRVAIRFAERVQRHRSRCWFVNTGWVGDPEGTGKRVPLSLTRRLVHAACDGALDDVAFVEDPVFLFQIPTSCPGVPPEWLDPRQAASDPGEYELRANGLARHYIRDFETFEDRMPDSVREMVAAVALNEESLDVMELFKLSI